MESRTRLWFSLLVLLTIITVVHSEYYYTPTVNTPLGKVIGYYKTSYNGRKYEAYEGIPYAEPPTGNLRFEEPVPVTHWGKLNATSIKSKCTQFIDISPDKNGQYVVGGRVAGQEDCLYINIYVPTLKKRRQKVKLPVIFIIHGGSFQHGSGNISPKYIIDRDVIVLTIQYRLGIQGFLSTEDEVLPGNLGLKDQNLALRWTSKYIGYFGGDTKKITLVGFSSGSSSVQYHYLSPLSRGLFHAGITASGSVFNPYGFAVHASEKAKELGGLFDCPTNSSRKMIDCLKKVPAQTLAASTRKFQYFQNMPEAPFAPVIEKAGSRPFINKSPKEIMEAKEVNDVPAVFSVSSDEGCDPAAGYIPHDNIMKLLNDDWINIAPYLLQYNYTVPVSLHNEIAIKARKKYFGNSPINKETGSQLIRLLTDVRFFIGIEEAARLQAKASKSPIYFYYYSFKGSQSRSEHLSHTKNNYGVCHCDDILLIIENPYINPTKTEEELKMSKFFIDLWVSVAYNGIPKIGVEWNPLNASDPKLNYLQIYELGNYSMTSNSNLGDKIFWRQYLLK